MRDLRSDQSGMNVLLIPLILAVVFLLLALGFGFWAFSGREDYKNNVDQKISTAVEVAKKETGTEKDNEFIEREKQPLKDYKGPSAFGSVQVRYPKTWSAYIDEAGSGSTPVNAFFHPSYVPSIASNDFNFALRVQIVDRPFADELRTYDTQVKSGKSIAQPYQPANIANVLGVKLEGEIVTKKQGIVVLLPLRDKTVKVWTEAEQYKKDFTENVLPNFSFTP